MTALLLRQRARPPPLPPPLTHVEACRAFVVSLSGALCEDVAAASGYFGVASDHSRCCGHAGLVSVEGASARAAGVRPDDRRGLVRLSRLRLLLDQQNAGDYA